METKYPELNQNKFHIVTSHSKNCILHGHDFLEFTYVLSGQMEHILDGKHSQVTKNSYFIVDHGTKHSYKQSGKEELCVLNILFYPEFIERTLSNFRSFKDVVNSYLLKFSYKSLNSSPTGVSFDDCDKKIKDALDIIIEEYNKKSDGYLEFIRCKLVEILILTMRKIGKAQKNSGKSDIIIQITDYIRSSYNKKINLTDIAESYNYSLSYISKKFSDEIGMSFTEYLQRIRIEQSCRMLETTELRVGEIASAVGYDNTKFFNEVFKNVLGLTPREFKKLHK